MFGFTPNTSLQHPIVDQSEQPSYQRAQVDLMLSRSEQLQLYCAEAQDAITYSQFAVAKYFDRKHLPPPRYKVGDKVFLNIAKKGQTGYEIAGVNLKKLGPQRSGPYTILKVLKQGHAVKIDLPPQSEIWPIISCIHLEPAPDEIRGDTAIPTPPLNVVDPGEEEGHQEYKVEAVLQTKNNGRYFKVKWKGYPIEQATWEPREILRNCQQMITEFEARMRPPSQPRRRNPTRNGP